MSLNYKRILKQVDNYRFLIPKDAVKGMRIDGMIYASKEMLDDILKDETVQQVVNVAMLPGLVGKSMVMPDAHQGYGFPIGGVAAADAKKGIISAGGVGFDINCGVRVLYTNLHYNDIKNHLEPLADELFANIPSGVGVGGKIVLNDKELNEVLRNGVHWALKKGYALEEDLDHIESRGRIPKADPSKVSKKAKDRGRDQIGTLGAGNHFLEVQIVDEIYDKQKAKEFGITDKGQITVMIHTGSRGLGHQVCSDYLDKMSRFARQNGIKVPDKELVYAPVDSPLGRDYLSAMFAAANFAFTNRQLLTYWTREVFKKLFPDSKLTLIYDIAHNIAKIEKHKVNGKTMEVIVHRKGATRAFPPGHPELPASIRPYGQPVLIPGSMGTYSFILVGTQKAMEETFGSVCHGAGRRLSRHKAKRTLSYSEILNEMKRKNIILRAGSKAGVVEEAPQAYKDVSNVVEVVHNAGLARKVVRLKPLIVIKG